jgi:hypothetical protein
VSAVHAAGVLRRVVAIAAAQRSLALQRPLSGVVVPFTLLRQLLRTAAPPGQASKVHAAGASPVLPQIAAKHVTSVAPRPERAPKVSFMWTAPVS